MVDMEEAEHAAVEAERSLRSRYEAQLADLHGCLGEEMVEDLLVQLREDPEFHLDCLEESVGDRALGFVSLLSLECQLEAARRELRALMRQREMIHRVES